MAGRQLQLRRPEDLHRLRLRAGLSILPHRRVLGPEHRKGQDRGTLALRTQQGSVAVPLVRLQRLVERHLTEPRTYNERPHSTQEGDALAREHRGQGHQGGLLRRRQAGDHAHLRKHTERRRRLRDNGNLPRLHASEGLGEDVSQLCGQRGGQGFGEPRVLTVRMRHRGSQRHPASLHTQQRGLHGVRRDLPQQEAQPGQRAA